LTDSTIESSSLARDCDNNAVPETSSNIIDIFVMQVAKKESWRDGSARE